MFGELRHNIPKLYLFKVLSSFLLFAPVLVLFFQENGLSMTEIMVLQALYSIAVILLEIPTGYIADYFTRKKALVSASLFLSAGISIYSFGTDFWSFLAAELVWSVGVALFHGTDSAMFYDTLVDLGRTESYKELWGKATSYRLVSAAVASILGGFIAEYGLRFTIIYTVPMIALLIPLTISLKEPQRHKEVTENHLGEIKESLKTAFIHKTDLRFLILYSALIVTLTKAVYWIYQPYFEASGLNIAYFGIVFAGFNIVAALASQQAHRIEGFLGRKKSLAALMLLSSAGSLLMGYIIFFYSFVFALLHQIVRGMREPIISDYINQIIESKRRSTILSVEHMASNTLYAAVVPFIGLYTDIYTYSAAMTLLGVTGLIAGTAMLTVFYVARSQN